MKNLLVHINPHGFNREHSIMAKIQIDNSLRFWDRKDIILVTNFPYEYNRVKSTILDVEFCPFRPRSMKTLTVGYMLEKGLIGDDIYWVHDFDAYQQEPLIMDLEDKDLAVTTYGWHAQWSLGSYFFNKRATDIFRWIKEVIYETKLEDEKSFVTLTKNNLYDINKRFKVIDGSYNFGMRYIPKVYKLVEKPLKVVHFHLWGKDLPSKDMFLNGKNELGIKLVTPELEEIFHKHGIK